MLKKEGNIVSKNERLYILRSILLQSFQYHKTDSTKRPLTCKTKSISTKTYLVNSL